MILVLLYIIHIFVSLFLIGVVLLQQGKGADLSVFGGGSTMTAFGARSATNILHKLTVVAFVSFMVTTLTIGVLQRGGGGTVMSAVEVDAPSEDAAAATASDEASSADAASDESSAEATGSEAAASDAEAPTGVDGDGADDAVEAEGDEAPTTNDEGATNPN